MSGGRDHKARGLAPPQRSHEPPSPMRKGALRKKGPGQWGQGPAPWGSLQHSLPAHYLFAFLPPSPEGNPDKVAQWVVPHLLDHCLLPPLCPIHPFLPYCLS